MATSKTEAAEIIAELTKLYPKAFSTDPAQVRPLAIGLKDVLLQQCTRPPKHLENAMRRYTGSAGYLKATVEGAVRVDLHGQDAGTVTVYQAEYAKRRLAKMAERFVAKPAVPATNGEVAKPPRVAMVDVARPYRMPTGNIVRPSRVAVVNVKDKVFVRPALTAPSLPTPSLSAPTTNGPRRLGLADLKQAAAARRTVTARDSANRRSGDGSGQFSGSQAST
jgi:sRNA-binding protein